MAGAASNDAKMQDSSPSRLIDDGSASHDPPKYSPTKEQQGFEDWDDATS